MVLGPLAFCHLSIKIRVNLLHLKRFITNTFFRYNCSFTVRKIYVFNTSLPLVFHHCCALPFEKKKSSPSSFKVRWELNASFLLYHNSDPSPPSHISYEGNLCFQRSIAIGCPATAEHSQLRPHRLTTTNLLAKSVNFQRRKIS